MKFCLVLIMITLAGCIVTVEAKVLDSLAIDGLVINQPSLVRNSIDLRVGKEFNTADVQESIRKLYALGIFRSLDFFISKETDSTLSVILKLKEFPFCEGIEFSGQKKLKDKDFEEKVVVKRGQTATDASIFQSEVAIKKVYAEKGYLLAEVKGVGVPTKVPGNVIVKFTIKEGPKVHVKKITFKGNKWFKSKKLAFTFKTKEARWWRGGDFNEDLYRLHLDSLIMFYNDQGYLDASIVKDSMWYSSSKKDIFIEITLDEGKKYYAGDFFFTGNKVIETDSLQSKISLKRGKPFQKSRFDQSKYFIENSYREEGFLWVKVDERRTYRGDTIDVMFDINEGRSAIVRKIDIKGNAKTMEKVIRREIDLMPGQKYKQSLMARSQQKIMALNFFSNVTPDLNPNDDGTIDLVFTVVEKDNIGQLSVGAAYSQIDKFVGTFSTAIPNFRGAGQELKLNVEFGLSKQDYSVSFTEPWAFDIPLLLSGSVFYDNSVLSNYDTTESYGFIATVGRPKLKWPDDHFTVRGSYQLSHDASRTLSARYPGLNVVETGVLSRVTADVERYDFDVPMFPTSGSKLSIIPAVAGIGGDYRYLKGTVGYEYYFPLPLKLVLGSRTKFGLIAGLPDHVIQISRYDLFRLGGVYGDGDLRGYPEYAFGAYKDPSQGVSMFVQNIELRYPILDQQLYLGVFADLGNTWGSLSEVDLAELHKGIGFGLRINIPMLGLMGFDFGWGLDDIRGIPFEYKPFGFEFHFLMNRGF